MENIEVPECDCGCDGSCERAAASNYELEAGVIDALIELAVAYNEKRWEKGASPEDDEEYLWVISILSDLWERGAMPEKQRLVFEETFGLSGCRGECVCDGGCDGC